MALLRYAARFDATLSLDCAPALHPGTIQGRDQILPSGNLEGNDKSAALREAFGSVLDTFTYELRNNGEGQLVKQHSLLVGNFMLFWLR